MTISLGFVCGVIRTGYSRYVAIGDSQTEGLWDGDDAVGVLGFADRLAVMLDSLYPGLQYANLAIRGKLVADVLREQVPEALAMQPDLITVCAGMNDVIQPGRSFGPALADLDYVYAALAESGATVVTTTFPNVAQFLPLGRLVSGRLTRINEAIRTAAGRYGFRLVDLYNAPSMRDLDTWDIDRVHASTKGHIMFAAAAAESLNLPGSNHDWADRAAVSRDCRSKPALMASCAGRTKSSCHGFGAVCAVCLRPTAVCPSVRGWNQSARDCAPYDADPKRRRYGAH